MLKRLFFILLVYAAAGAASAQSVEQEAKLKAVFIYNFTSYIEWDTSMMKSDFIIGVVGNSAVTQSLQQISRSKSVKNKRIIVKVFTKPDEIETCHILFIPE